MKRFIVLAFIPLVLSIHSLSVEIDNPTIQLIDQKMDSFEADPPLTLIHKPYKIETYQKALLYHLDSEQLSPSINYLNRITVDDYQGLMFARNISAYSDIHHFNKSNPVFIPLYNLKEISKADQGWNVLEINIGNYGVETIRSPSVTQLYETSDFYLISLKSNLNLRVIKMPEI